ncbi:MAG: hypothetical protein GWN00_01935 [Aliifodinibius sp.]|nr:carboxypeptidase regulatory-like domain-containing protein [Fodinibius sp.]NIY23617.1 hypothetical protein [Fodinibius sp.]
MPVAISGSVSGTVTDPQSLPTAFALQNSDTVTTSIVDPFDGFFRLSFLPAGIYTVSIRDTANRSATTDSVEVVAGLDNNLGNIELQY